MTSTVKLKQGKIQDSETFTLLNSSLLFPPVCPLHSENTDLFRYIKIEYWYRNARGHRRTALGCLQTAPSAEVPGEWPPEHIQAEPITVIGGHPAAQASGMSLRRKNVSGFAGHQQMIPGVYSPLHSTTRRVPSQTDVEAAIEGNREARADRVESAANPSTGSQSSDRRAQAPEVPTTPLTISTQPVRDGPGRRERRGRHPEQ